MRTAGAIALSFLVTAWGADAAAADVRLISADPMAGTIKAVAAQFERATGHRLIASFVSGPMVKRDIDAGETFDVAISVTPVIDALIAEKKLNPATRTDLATTGVGLGVRVGAAKPGIASVEALKRALLNAKSVAFSSDGVGGVYFRGLLDRLGIAEAMKEKLKPMTDDVLARAVPSGQAEMIVGAVSNVTEFGADLVGPLPMEVQISIPFAAAIGTATKEPQAAKALIDFLRTPAVAAAMKAHGLEPK